MNERIICGTAFHVPSKGRMEMLKDVAIVVGGDGTIRHVMADDDPDLPAAKKQAHAEGRLTQLPKGQYLFPGLVDLHIHAPQWPQLGKALDVPLEVWLQQHTFPLEAKYKDVEFA